MMKKFKVVIGANYGDEGKGLATDYFAHKASIDNRKSLVVLHNGGPQRGHTVVTPEGYRHVFRHIGAGTFAGSDTFLAESFIVNPMELRRELDQLDREAPQCSKFTIYISAGCRITTHMDMMANQMKEEARGEDNFGTCGMGIWETVLRNSLVYNPRSDHLSITLGQLLLCKPDIRTALKNIRNYYLFDRLCEIPRNRISQDWTRLFVDDAMDEHYIQDFMWMVHEPRIKIVPEDNLPLYYAAPRIVDEKHTVLKLLDSYDTIIFENGQGLLIDGKIKKGDRFNTPSHSDSTNPYIMIEPYVKMHIEKFDIEVCYVSRPYLTRHGKGELLDECHVSDIPSDEYITDPTNKPNQFQGSLRYGHLNYDKLATRVFGDYKKWETLQASNVNRLTIDSSLFITHKNEYKPAIPGYAYTICHNLVYISDGLTRESVRRTTLKDLKWRVTLDD